MPRGFRPVCRASVNRRVFAFDAPKRTLRVMRLRLLTLVAAMTAFAAPATAAMSDVYESDIVSARLVAAPNGVAPGVGVISAGLEVDLAPGWKTYWRSPGEVGLPPQLDWSASDNVVDLAMLFPSPERFRAFGIENYGYEGRVLYPLELTLAAPGAAMKRLGLVLRCIAVVSLTSAPDP